MRGTNYNYGRDHRRTPTDLTTMEAFDLLGPLTREAVNAAPVLLSARNLFVGGIVDRGMSDEQLARHVRENAEREFSRLEQERQAMQGVWAEPIKAPKQRNRTFNRTSQNSTKRCRRPTQAWLAAAAARAMQTPVPRSEFHSAT